MSPSLELVQFGMMAHGEGIEGDHRNIFADFHETSFLGSEMFTIMHPKRRRLKLFDIRIVKRFNNAVIKHFTHNNLNKKITALQSLPPTTPPEVLQRHLDTIDDQVGRAIVTAEKHCRKLRDGAIPFSSKYKEVNTPRRFWLLLLRKKYGRRVSSTTLRRLAKKLDIQHMYSIDFEEARFQLHQSRKKYIALSLTAKSERDIFNENLSIARAEHENTTASRALRRIIKEEEQRTHNSIMSTVYRKLDNKRLDTVQVRRDGTWVELTSPREIEQAVRDMNNDKYSSTNETPMMSPHFVNSIGYLAEKEGATSVLDGTFVYPPDSPPSMHTMIDYLRRVPDIPDIPSFVTPQEYSSAWACVKEKRSSSHSGRHFGVYKSVCKHPELLNTFTDLFNLPFQHGLPYNRWKNFLDVMAFKDPDDRRVHRLRSLVLGEADWNMGGRVFINRRMMRNAESSHTIPDEHFGGRKGRRATQAVLTKRLLLDNLRLERRPGAVLSTDIANCYDRMVHSYVSLCGQRLGVSLPVMIALLTPLQESRHYVRTAYGDSNSYYGGKRTIPYQGLGQGNAASSPFWLVVSSPLVDIIKDSCLCATLVTAITLTTVLLTLVIYVDDTDMFITSNSTNAVDDIVRKAQQILFMWRDSLRITGGVVRPDKCSWLLVDFKWNNGICSYQSASDHYAQLRLDDAEGNVVPLDRIEPQTGVKGLGVVLQADGNEDSEIGLLETRIEKWKTQITSSFLPAYMNLNALHTRITKTISYPLPATCIPDDICKRLDSMVYSFSLPKCGVSSKLPLVIRHSPLCFFGLALHSTINTQGVSHILEMLYHLNNDTLAQPQLQCSLELAHLWIGHPDWIFHYDFPKIGSLLPQSWVRHTWQFMSAKRIQLKGPHIILHQSRAQDSFLIPSFLHHNPSQHELHQLNTCRMHLQALTISDLCNASGTHLTTYAYNGRRDPSRTSCYRWPRQPRPPIHYWSTWDKYMELCYVHAGTKRLRRPLGKWSNRSHQSWSWYIEDRTETVFRNCRTHWVLYTVDDTMRLATRTQGRWYKYSTIAHHVDPSSLRRCTIDRRTTTHVLVTGRTHDIIDEDQRPYHTTSINPDRTYQILTSFSDNDDGTTLLHKLTCQPFRIVGDGSYDHSTGLGSCTTIIETVDMSSRVSVGSIVPSNSSHGWDNDNDPYRCELYAIMIGLQVLLELESRSTSQFLPATLSVDNDQALYRGSDPTLHISTTDQHFDVLWSIHKIIRLLRTKFTIELVQGHLDRTTPVRLLPRPSQLNIECDKMARYIRENYSSYPSLQPSLTLAHEQFSVWTNGSKLYNKSSDTLHFHASHPEARSYYMKKYHWDDELFDSVNWKASGLALSSVTPHTRTWIAKLSCGFAGLGEMLDKRNYWKSGTCPRCKQHIENNKHVLSCPHPIAREKFNNGLSNLENWMTRSYTDRTLAAELLRASHAWIEDPTMRTFWSPCVPVMMQLRLGWHHFFYGRIHQELTHFQHRYFRRMGYTRSALSWTKRLIINLISDVVRPLWQHRNLVTHALDKESTHTRLHTELMQDVTDLYSSTLQHNLLSVDRHLMDTPLNTLLTWRYHSLKSWKDSFETAISSRDRQFEPTRDNNLRAYYPVLHDPTLPLPAPPRESIRTPLPRPITVQRSAPRRESEIIPMSHPSAPDLQHRKNNIQSQPVANPRNNHTQSQPSITSTTTPSRPNPISQYFPPITRNP